MWTRRPTATRAPALRSTDSLAHSLRHSFILVLLAACSISREAAPPQAVEPLPAAISEVEASRTDDQSIEEPVDVQPSAPADLAQSRPAELKAAPARTRELAADRSVSGGVLDGLIGAPVTVTGSSGLGARGTGLGGGGAYGAKDARASYDMPPQAPVQPNTEGYTSYGVNDMTLAERDHLSTFSIDVDTASYTIARRKLNEGALPPQAAVRVEEFVNYFPYSYAQPTGDAPFSVNFEAAPNPWEPNHQLVRVGVQGRTLETDEEKPRRLTFLVDTSGSMQSSDKIELVKESLRYLVNQLGPEDSVAIVTYAGWTKVVLPATPVTRKRPILDAIDELSASGSTAMGSGIELAYKQASKAYVRGAENRVLVLSDGDANVGPTSHEQILETIHRYAGEGITLSTVGFGMGNYKDTMMEQLADKGDGNYFYVDSLDQGKRIFGQDLSGTMNTIARDVKIQVDWNSNAVLSYRLVGYENRDIADKDFRNDKVDAGEVGSGHSVTALYDVVLKDRALTDNKAIATVAIRAKQPGPDQPAREWSTQLRPTAFHSEIADTSADFRIATAAASFAEVLRGSRYTNELSYADVYRLAQGAQRRNTPEDAELLDLIARAGELSGQQGPWSSGRVADR